MSYLADKKRTHEADCEAAIRAGDSRKAIFHAAKAAEFAYALAEQTAPAIARRYIEDAEGWLEIAERLRKNPLSGTKTGSRSRGGCARSPVAETPSTPGDSEFELTEKPAVSFDQIAGMESAKRTIHEIVVYPLRHIEKARALGLRAGGGVLLYGPPGNGKTLLGKAIATELNCPFFYASGAQIRSKWHGESEQRLSSLVQAARQRPTAVLFLDEVDGLLPRRGSGGSVVDNRIVTQFLADVGGFRDSENVLLILGATNKPWEIDEAVFRTGRFDEKLYVGLPDPPARLGILKMHLDNLILEPGFDIEGAAGRFEGFTGSDIVGIVTAAKRIALGRAIRDDAEPALTLADIEKAFEGIPSSVTPRMLQQYERFREQRFG